MTKDDILRMAREAGLHDPMVFYAGYERFAALVAAAEREECSKLASMLAKAFVLAEREKCAQLIETYEKAGNMVGAPHFVMVLKDCAAAIRARGQG